MHKYAMLIAVLFCSAIFAPITKAQKIDNNINLSNRVNILSVKFSDILSTPVSTKLLIKENSNSEDHFIKLKEEKNKTITLSLLSAMLIVISIIAFYSSRKHKRLYKTLQNKNKSINKANIALRNTIATRDRLISVIAHDIKNPLGTLSGFAELILMNPGDTSTIKGYAKTIIKSSNNLYSLLENLLEWARSQKENIVLHRTFVNVNKMTEATFNLLEPIANEYNIFLINKCEKTLNILADPNTAHTIIRNIVSNAIKFSEPHSMVTISAELQEESIIIHIHDSGPGISEEDIPKLFKQDVDREKIGNHKNKGTGVGLLLCKEFVDLNEGSIEVKSEFGKGSIFSVHFPKYKIGAH